MRKIFFIFAIFSCLQIVVNAFVVPQTPTGYVNDYAGMLSVETRQQLEDYLKTFTAGTSNEIAVVTIADLGGDTIEHYANLLFEKWKIGNEKNDNGVLLLISRDEHKIRIEVGYGLEGALPDILAKDIIDTKITPQFKQANYDAGVVAGVNAIVEATKGEYKSSGKSKSGFLNGNFIEFVIIAIFIILQFLSSILARSKSWWAGGVLGGIIGSIITYIGFLGLTIITGSVVTIILVILGLVFDYVVSNAYNSSISRGNSIPWWAGGGGSGSGSSSFGGFGGGSSGGGGASGSW